MTKKLSVADLCDPALAVNDREGYAKKDPQPWLRNNLGAPIPANPNEDDLRAAMIAAIRRGYGKADE